MSPAFQKLRARLAELFQLDAAAELDFGIYRILNARRGEIARFLDSLEAQVEGILGQAGADAGAPVRAELEKVEAGLRAGGIDEAMIATAPKVRELREKLDGLGGAGQEAGALRDEIFSLLTTFFSRYYKDGDFLSLRRYKADTYAIPYEGEEVKLHWANADQFYIKSAENFRDYTFRLGSPPTGDVPDTRPRVTFKLIEADTEKDNNKPVAGKERRFIFHSVLPSDEPGSLMLGFTYEPGGKDQKQADLNGAAARAILDQCAKGPFIELASPRPTEKKKDRTLLDKHLADYTARNTFDYFIHKDLGGFLRRELDFFIKNEVVHLDDLDDAPEQAWSSLRARLKALRTIAHKVIRFLAQIEDFQKKLWLKKKFVTGCDYVVTLDRLPEELYPAIAACDAQREEWVRLFAIDEIKGDLGRTGYSVPLTVEFLKENRFLPVDTRFGNSVVRDVVCNSPSVGLLIDSDCAAGLKFLRHACAARISTVFTDPPYNTGDDGFAYKDAYQHSSWLSMIAERFSAARELMNERGLLFATIDFVEVSRMRVLLDSIFGDDGFVADIAWEKRYTRSNNAKRFYSLKDTVLAYRRSSVLEEIKERRSEKSKENYSNPDKDNRGVWISSSYVNPATKAERPNLDYKLTNPFTGREVEHPTHAWKYDRETHVRHVADNRMYWGLDGGYEYPRLKSFLSEAKDGMVPVDVWQHEETGTTDDGGKALKELFGSETFRNPKPPRLIQRCIGLEDRSLQSSTILDFFAGSGTTGHAVINLNREDGGNRRYILVEMGEHFETVLVPRLKKVIYAKEWKDGKPVSRESGISHCFKVLRLESYEDTLNNLRLRRTPEQEAALDQLDLSGAEAAEEYRLGYMLDLESAGSASLLNVGAFSDPWNYTLDVATGTAGETRPVAVDLVETFNWLLGLTVEGMARSGGVLWVEGTNPEGEKVLVLWRKTTGEGAVEAKALNEWCRKMKVSVLDGEYGLIYVNGDHHLENLRREDQTWKVRLIDEEFPRLMFSE